MIATFFLNLFLFYSELEKERCISILRTDTFSYTSSVKGRNCRSVVSKRTDKRYSEYSRFSLIKNRKKYIEKIFKKEYELKEK